MTPLGKMKTMSEKQTSYQILNKFLPVGFVHKILVDTLNAYEAGENISDSPLIQWGHRALEQGAWWHGVEKVSLEKREKALQRRQRNVIELYLDIKNNGYNDSVISIFFDEDGNIKTYDGFHRLSIIKYLGMEVMINCRISTRKTDFPLVETVMELNSGTNLYQPCEDERLREFHVWRPDSPKRLSRGLKNFTGKTVLDIGCSEGYFSRELTKRGYQVTALDYSKKRLAVTRYLATINNLEMDYYFGRWQNYVVDKGFDNILYLSVFHHDILTHGVDEAFKQLELFRGKAKRLLFESPTSSKKISWTPEDKKDLYDFTEKEFGGKLEEATEMFITKIWHGIRPIFLLEASR